MRWFDKSFLFFCYHYLLSVIAILAKSKLVLMENPVSAKSETVTKTK